MSITTLNLKLLTFYLKAYFFVLVPGFSILARSHLIISLLKVFVKYFLKFFDFSFCRFFERPLYLIKTVFLCQVFFDISFYCLFSSLLIIEHSKVFVKLFLVLFSPPFSTTCLLYNIEDFMSSIFYSLFLLILSSLSIVEHLKAFVKLFYILFLPPLFDDLFTIQAITFLVKLFCKYFHWFYPVHIIYR